MEPQHHGWELLGQNVGPDTRGSICWMETFVGCFSMLEGHRTLVYAAGLYCVENKTAGNGWGRPRQGGCPCCLELGVPAFCWWWTRHSPPSACQLCPAMQVSSPSDAAFRRFDIPLSPGGLRLYIGLGRMGHPSARRFPRDCGSSRDLPAGPTFLLAPAGGRDWLQILGGRQDWVGAAGWRLPSSLRPGPGSERHGPICIDWHLEPGATPGSFGPAIGWFSELTVPSGGHLASWGD